MKIFIIVYTSSEIMICQSWDIKELNIFEMVNWMHINLQKHLLMSIVSQTLGTKCRQLSDLLGERKRCNTLIDVIGHFRIRFDLIARLWNAFCTTDHHLVSVIVMLSPHVKGCLFHLTSWKALPSNFMHVQYYSRRQPKTISCKAPPHLKKEDMNQKWFQKVKEDRSIPLKWVIADAPTTY